MYRVYFPSPPFSYLARCLKDGLEARNACIFQRVSKSLIYLFPPSKMGNMAIKKSKSSVTIYFAPLDEVCVYVYVYVQKASSKFLADTRSAKHPPTKTQVDAGGTKEMLAKHTQAPRKRKGFAPLGSPRLSRKKKLGTQDAHAIFARSFAPKKDATHRSCATQIPLA